MRIEWTLFAMNDREAIFDYLEADSPRAAILIDDRIEAQAGSAFDRHARDRASGPDRRNPRAGHPANALYCSLQN